MIVEEPGVQGNNAIYQADIYIGVELAHLVEVHRREKTVPPAERRVGIHNQIGCFSGFCDNVLKDAPSKRVKPFHRNVQNLAGRNIGRLGVHPVADVAQQHFFALPGGKLADILKVALLINADHPGNDNNHIQSDLTIYQ